MQDAAGSKRVRSPWASVSLTLSVAVFLAAGIYGWRDGLSSGCQFGTGRQINPRLGRFGALKAWRSQLLFYWRGKHRFGMLMIAKKLGIELTHVPYKSTAQSIVDVASGMIQLQLATIAPTIPMYQAGKVRVLGVASDHRIPSLPDIPTLKEQGVDVQAKFSLGLFLPVGSSDGVIKLLK
jgi:hypothetical protein